MKLITRKFFIWINLYFFLIISALALSFTTYKLIELKAKANINTNIQEDLILRWNLQNWSTSLNEKLYKYLQSWEWRLYYISDDKDLEKLKTREYCFKKNLIIQNWKNFQEILIQDLADYNSIFVTPIDHIYVSHCYFSFNVFDSITIKIK